MRDLLVVLDAAVEQIEGACRVAHGHPQAATLEGAIGGLDEGFDRQFGQIRGEPGHLPELLLQLGCRRDVVGEVVGAQLRAEHGLGDARVS